MIIDEDESMDPHTKKHRDYVRSLVDRLSDHNDDPDRAEHSELLMNVLIALACVRENYYGEGVGLTAAKRRTCPLCGYRTCGDD